MKLYYLVLLFSVFQLASCQNTNPQNEDNSSDNWISEDNTDNTESKQQDSKPSNSSHPFWEKLEMRSLRDGNGVVVAELPVPNSWKFATHIQAGDPIIEGPHGLKIYNYPGKVFMYTNDPMMQQVYAQNGNPMRLMPGIDAFIAQDIRPQLESKGTQILNIIDIPDVANSDKWYSNQLYSSAPKEIITYCKGLDLLSKEGKKIFLMLRMTISNMSGFQNWFYQLTALEADDAFYDKTKKQFIFAYSNTRYALEPIMAYNRKEAEKEGRNWAAFNQRMAQNQAAFEARQRAHINNTNAINDAIMSGYKSKSAASDRIQEKTIDGIREETNVRNAETGSTYKVDAGYNNYWMNNDGEYISTDLHDYNPNLDKNMNEVNWQKLNEMK